MGTGTPEEEARLRRPAVGDPESIADAAEPHGLLVGDGVASSSSGSSS